MVGVEPTTCFRGNLFYSDFRLAHPFVPQVNYHAFQPDCILFHGAFHNKHGSSSLYLMQIISWVFDVIPPIFPVSDCRLAGFSGSIS